MNNTTAALAELPTELLDKALLSKQFAASDDFRALSKTLCQQASDHLDNAFRADADIQSLIRLRARFIDTLLCSLWEQFDWQDAEITLAAVGGYGRGELHPGSDIDLLLLTGTGCDGCLTSIEQFVTLLWDIKLAVGHSVRSIEQCVKEAEADITVVTALLEARLIVGSAALLDDLREAISPQKIWPSDAFFRAKWTEQRRRHHKYADTEYNLEPNVKSSPGGLRDTQVIGWIALRQYDESNPRKLAELEFLTEDELSTLINGRDFLWRVRYGLHMLAGREEDRLLFDYQRELATLFGYNDTDKRLAVEQFMQQYYRWALALAQLNEVLMQHFDQVILHSEGPEQIEAINARFQIRNGYIETCHEDVFVRDPSALLEVFVLSAQLKQVAAVHVSTIRQIHTHRDLIDGEFRAKPENRQLFIELLKSPYKLGRVLRRMNRYGILGQYLPEFGKIVGQMQHDLFHIYTVDAHTLEVVKNMRRFMLPRNQEKFPVTSRVASRLPKRELLYIAGLYHDIGKGRGGDHSELGAVDARIFCENHALSESDTELVVWLVQSHLYMSGVAQRKDITDPDVIQQFATAMGDQLHLDYLLVMTVADINATNPTLWNAWRGSLLRQLYTETKRALSRGLENQIEREDVIEQTQNEAREELEGLGFTDEEIGELWAAREDDYFLREKSEDIVWHTDAVAMHYDKDKPLVLVKPAADTHTELATQILIHARAQDYLFSATAASMEQLDLSIQDARIYTAADGMAMDTFYVLDGNGESIAADPGRIRHITEVLTEQLSDAHRYPEIVKRRTPRQNKFFAMPTETRMSLDEERQLSVLEVITPDRPGLLARIGRIFFDLGIELQAAKIATLGERVEDVFFITTKDQLPITDSKLRERIQDAIRTELDQQAAA
ncbi:[protein-PII] uridylyltransferase [Halieaceae bacterium IMCC14734]|uniref:Bifunctional uridylyltransferase/uridylyl-removing enzyme n=1 Tax=Candidatus Litorirhabdus singularis TaxID=2518993 RepID=A0ABT3TIX3_9GAMM|nr:[protein-PII] uridylyltransferase [Candidatus Litorirhabdus singularis]MCX2982155.1 [protein-PII] uridylyltransferase [Candidatus Litorirhabdus singularis]